MPKRQFLFLASFVIVLRWRLSLGQKSGEVVARNFEIKNDNDRVTIEVRPARNRENNSNTTERIDRRSEGIDDTGYWESIYGSTDDIQASEDRSKTNGPTVELKIREDSRDDDSSEKHDIIHENVSQLNEKMSNTNGSWKKKVSRGTSASNLSRDRHEWKNRLFFTKKSSTRRKRDTNDSRDKIKFGKLSKPEAKRKERNLSVHHDGSARRGIRSFRDMANSSESIEPCTTHKCSHERYIHLNVNCTNEEFHRKNVNCQQMNYHLRIPRDGNLLPLGFLQSHLSHGHDLALDMHDRARSLASGGSRPSLHTASMLNFFHSKAHTDLVNLNKESEFTLFAMKLLQQKLATDYNVTSNNFLEYLNDHRFRVKGARVCRQIHQNHCDQYDKFRSLDGSCNNIGHSSWGRRNTAFGRILPARYSDGIHEMPISVTKAKLPNARKLSARLYPRAIRHNPELTVAVMQWGQNLAHDLARQVMDQTTEGGIECCADNGKNRLDKSLQHHSCAPISISASDKFYSRYGVRCMNFVRGMTAPREDCTLGPANQLNGATSFLDLSQMYGVSETVSEELREFTGGRMKMEFRSGRWMLPTRNRSADCDIWTSDDVCYQSGDPRTNQNPQLVVQHTILVREHNRVADILLTVNPHWKDERIFQEARRIVIAEYQHITYSEWLPLMIGERYAKKNNLMRTARTMSNDYNANVDPSTIIGFTSGAFRSLHSMVAGHVGLGNVERDCTDVFRLSDHYFRPRVIEKDNNFEGLLRGLVTQHVQMQDMNLNSELTEYLFCSRNTFGMDLAAIDIQRGRDHGVPSYNAYRKICDLEPAEDFDDLHEEISWENIQKLRREYAHVDDIDLIVGVSMENILPDSRFGPTNRCLIGEQFYRSRVGDRYFYENENFPHSFTTEQFHEITKITLARLICNTVNDIDTIQREAFRAITWQNHLVACENLPEMDLTLWKE